MPFVFVETSGGLGNVLFQLAAGLTHARSIGTKCFAIQRGFSPSALGPRTTYWTTLLADVYTVPESYPLHDAIIHQDYDDKQPVHPYWPIVSHDMTRNLLLKGNYQDKQHFWKYKAELARLFIRPNVWCAVQTLIKAINVEEQQPMAFLAFLHVRRGDYKSLQQYHPLLPVNYYERAMHHFPLNTKFLVFCELEDLASIRRDFSSQLPPEVNNRLLWNDTVLQQPDYMQFLTMVACPAGGIIANSTFSTWAAMLHDCKHSIRTTTTCRFVCPKILFAHAPWFGKEIQDARWICRTNDKHSSSSSSSSQPPLSCWHTLQHNKSKILVLLQKVQSLHLKKWITKEAALNLLSHLHVFTTEEHAACQELKALISKG